MNSTSKLISGLLIFSSSYLALRFFGPIIGINLNVLFADLSGVAYLYSTVSTLFAVLAAFVIVSESQDWMTLNTASRNELRQLADFLSWSKELSPSLSTECSQRAVIYLETVIRIEWPALQNGKSLDDHNPKLEPFHKLIDLASKEAPEIASRMSSALNEMMDNRSVRIEYSWQPLPSILKFTVLLVDLAVILLSLFIGVHSIWLDYLFLLSIATIGLVIAIVIDDLDNPLRPGAWYLQTKDYENLLKSIAS